MARNLSARVLIVNQLRNRNAYSQLIGTVGDAEWGLLAFGGYKPGYTTSERTVFSYGPDRGNFAADRFGALIIATSVFPASRSEWPGVGLFSAHAQSVLPVALVHDEPLPAGIELAPDDIAVSAERSDVLRESVTEWLGQAMMLLQARF